MQLIHRHGILGFAFAAVAALTACPTPIEVDTGDDACAGDPLCIACTFDTDCPNDGVCSDGVCAASLGAADDPGPGASDGGCSQTSECSLDQMCNGSTGTCDPLPAGWCRRDVDCSGGASLCSASNENVPGLCVECLADIDCSSGERCGAGGACLGDGNNECPANSSFTGGTCRCNAGFHLDATTHTCESDTPSAGCVEHAHPIAGQAGRCECDLGYESSTDGNACVRPPNGGGGGSTPPPGGTPPGGDTGGDSGGIFGNCGPNTIAVFFVCFCLPGFEPNPNGDIGCSEDADPPADPPATGGEDPTDPGTGTDPQPSTDVCEENGWYSDDVCDQFCANPDPDCADPAAETPGTDTDVCQTNGWYGDDVCDTFCPSPDPDCAAATTPGTPASDVCETNGWYDDGTCDTFCENPDPDCNAAADVCQENGWYGDNVCDTFCANPDPDCDTTPTPAPSGSGDVCTDNGWYNDGTCDTFCPTADPDCDAPTDICEANGWYSDMVCDTNCASPDPDCSDACVENDWYGDGVCDTFCPLADPDC